MMTSALHQMLTKWETIQKEWFFSCSI
jgi:hypothetical protein